jgi:sarcosine oxidase subunit gamma
MPEGVPAGGTQIVVGHGRNVFRLKSWVVGITGGSKPVTLAGRELPADAGGTLRGSARALCTGPGEWLVVSPGPGAGRLPEQIEQELVEQGVALVDLSDGLGVLEVSGRDVRELLCKGCGLDLHAATFAPGSCARTRFAQIPVVIECIDETRFEVYVARSYLQYLHAWLSDAAVELDG